MMVIESSFWVRGVGRSALLLVIIGSFLPLRADEIVKKNGTIVDGQITGISSGQIGITIGAARSVVYLSDVQSVTMTPPAAMAKLDSATPEAKISILEPLVKQYAGLPADWVLDAMGQLADAYDA